MLEPQSLSKFARLHKINRDELLDYLVELGVVSDIRTITEKGLKIGIKYFDGKTVGRDGKWPVYGEETEELIKGHKFVVPADAPLRKNKKSEKNMEISKEITKNEFKPSVANQFLIEFNDLLKLDKYLARSDYKFLIEKYKDDYDTFIKLQKTNTLSFYATSNNFDLEKIKEFINKYDDIKDLAKDSTFIMQHNNTYIDKQLIDKKEYLDYIFNDNVRLDEEQRKVVLSDEDYTLVVAGAGAGKSTTVAAKVKYLIEKLGIKPEEILVVSFTNDSVNDLKKKIETKLKIKGCDICTFHKVGYKIIKDHSKDNFNVANSDTLFDVIDKYLKTEVLKDSTTIDNLILFFSYYLNVPFDEADVKKVFEYIANATYEPLKSFIEDNSEAIIRNNKINSNNKINITINREPVRSLDEVVIANFLYLNSIEYKYEDRAPFNIPHNRKDLSPDFHLIQGDKDLWYEHFGLINEDKTSTRSKNEVDRYIKEINDKIKCFKEHDKELIYTYHEYNDGRSIREHLQEILENKGFVFKRRSNEEIYKKIVDNAESQYIGKLVKLIVRFIGNFKACGYNEDKFIEWINENRDSKKSESIRTKIFLEICYGCYLEYQRQLKSKQELDFQDMINDSRKILEKLEKENNGTKCDYGYKYIIVDEFQDISKQRFDFTATLSRVTNAKIVAVGDDWQSIYAFSGSDLDSFIEFSKRMGYAQELAITSTRRNSQELLDIAGKFIMKNDKQKKKPLVSNKSVDKPVIIETYNTDNIPQDSKGGKFYAYGLIVEKIIEDIIKHNEIEGKKETSILLIGRYNFDGYNLSQRTGLFHYENHILSSVKYPNIKLRFLTAHRSKGLEEDNVIIINAKDDLFGFPSKIDNDPILDLVIEKDDSIDYAEERRLFYVALTRTKNRVYIAVPEDRPSRFITELLNEKEYNNIERIGNINLDNISLEDKNIRKCPHCGYPLQFQYNKKLDKKLWICKNEKELCGFMTNWYIDDKNENLKKFRLLSILRCDDPNCKNGYLIVRKNANKDEFFLGCTNYHSDLKCKRQMPLNEYLKLYNNGEI